MLRDGRIDGVEGDLLSQTVVTMKTRLDDLLAEIAEASRR